MHPISQAKREKLETLLGYGVVRAVVATKVPGVEVPEWWTEPYIPLDLTYANGIAVCTDDDGMVVTGLKSKGVLFSVAAPWAAIVRIAKYDGSECEDWPLDPEEFPSPEQDENNAYLMVLPRQAITRDDAIQAIHLIMFQLGELKSDDMVRFVLAKLPRGAYTGLKLVVDNTKPKSTFKPDPEPSEPPPLNVA